MVYKSVSIKEVFSRIARNTGGNIPSEYFEYFLEWIPEAMGKMKTKYRLQLVSEDVEIINHTAKLPCGFESLSAVTYNNRRLREGGDERDVLALDIPDSASNAWINDQLQNSIISNEDDDSTITTTFDITYKGETMTKYENKESLNHWYRINLGYIQTSFEEGCIKLHYYKYPVDEDGYPLIPDNEHYKTALYWYCLMMMIGAGYDHKIFKYSDCEQRWEQTAARARNSITFPNIDRMERIKQVWTALIPPEHMYDNYFTNSEQIHRVL